MQDVVEANLENVGNILHVFSAAIHSCIATCFVESRLMYTYRGYIFINHNQKLNKWSIDDHNVLTTPNCTVFYKRKCKMLNKNIP